MTPTAEQQAILAAVRERKESLMISALAGCGKTTTLEMIARALPPGPALALAFNKKIAKELEKRFPSTFVIKTLNGLGHAAFQKAVGRRLELDEKKLGKLVTKTARERGVELLPDQWIAVRDLVEKAMLSGICPEGTRKGLLPDEDHIWMEIAAEHWLEGITPAMLSVARQVLRASVQQAMDGIISFDDQIYMSVFFGGVFPRFPLVMVDEAQDLSVLNRMQIERCASGRLIVVGDPRQAIYAFRGADSSNMQNLRKLRGEWIDLPLATTFRCPKSVVAHVSSHAIGFTAAETNSEGRIANIFDLIPVRDAEPESGQEIETRTLPAATLAEHGVQLSRREPTSSWQWSDVPVRGSVAVLCRNNAPLMGLAFKLIRSGVGVQMLGRDIGKGLVATLKKIVKGNDKAEDCIRSISEWRDSESAKLRANDKDAQADGVEDRAECLLAVLEQAEVKDRDSAITAIERIFASSGLVTLATGHKAKGLEWETVVHLDPWRVPAKWAKGAQREQEMNLRYVIETRTKYALIEANLEDFSS